MIYIIVGDTTYSQNRAQEEAPAHVDRSFARGVSGHGSPAARGITQNAVGH
jgi:hypothetical protein